MKLILLIILLIKTTISYKFSVIGFSTVKICNENQCSGREHTTCFSEKISKNCKNFNRIKFTSEHVNQILMGHNGLRNRVAMNSLRPASNMNLLHWDYDLEMMAAKWLVQCNLQPDVCDFIINSTITVGQNYHYLPKLPTKHSGIIAIIRSWYLEGNLFDSELISNMIAGRERNFSQLVWAETEFVGCAAAK